MNPRMVRFRIILSAALAAGVVIGAVGRGWSAQPAADDSREAKLIAMLQSAAPPQDKAIACKQLALCGTKNAVPPLAALLGDPQLASWARIALEVIPDPEADAALREAAGKLQGRLLIGVINSLAFRRDVQAVELLVVRLNDADAEVAAAAAVALGRIATDPARAALEAALAGSNESVRSAVAEGLILCAENLSAQGKADLAAALYDRVRAADVPKTRKLEATRGAILARGKGGTPLLVECLRSNDDDWFRLALGVARELGGEEVARALVAEIDAMEPPPAESPDRIELEEAIYGAGDRTFDVTDRVREMLAGGTAKIEASNSLGGDPAPSVVKQLRVTYVAGGKQQTVVVPEGQTIELGQAMPEGDPRQVLLIHALGDLGQQAALATMLEAARGGSFSARLAAARVLGRIGDARAVGVLVESATGSGELARAAIESLTVLKGQGVDQAIVAALDASTGSRRAALIEVVGQRAIRSAVPSLLKDAEAEDANIRLAAIHALGMTADAAELDALLKPLLAPRDEAEAEAAKTALLLACPRMADPDATAAKLLGAMPGATASGKAALLEILGALGGKRALEGVAAAARGGDDALADAATAVLGQWMSPEAATALIDLARRGPEKYRVRALRGYLRIARQLNVPIDQRMAMCRTALEVAQRDAEKKLALEVLGRYPAVEGLRLAVAQLGAEAVRAEAATAAVAIAEKLARAEPAAVADAMRAVATANVPPELAARAKAVLAQVEKRP